MKKKILHILSTDRISGAENVAADICMMFSEEYDMYYASPDGEIKQSLVDRDVSYYPLERLSPKEIKKAINHLKPDILHAHDVKATVLSCLATKTTPIISHLHGNAENMRRVSIKSLIYMLSSKRVRNILYVSKSCLDDYFFRKQIIVKSMYLQNVVYYPRIEKLIEKDPNRYEFDFCFVGRLAHAKDPKRVAIVASKVLRNLPNSKFGIIGDGEYKGEMEKIFISEGVQNQVTFTGKLPYPYKALQQSKCLLMCSKYEGTPIVALESIALGIPMVSTETDGLVELIKNKETGFLSDDDDILANSIIQLILDSELRSKFVNKQNDTYDILGNIYRYKDELCRIYKP